MPNAPANLWEVELVPTAHSDGGEHRRLVSEMEQLSPLVTSRFSRSVLPVRSCRGFFVETSLPRERFEPLARSLFADPIVEQAVVHAQGRSLPSTTITVLRKPGVMDPASRSAEQALSMLGAGETTVRTFHRVEFEEGTPTEAARFAASKAIANEAVDQIIAGTVHEEHLTKGKEYVFRRVDVLIREMDDPALERLSREGQLYLDLPEMQAIREHFRSLGRDPSDIELESLAQTWSEHCSHKTLRGPYEFNGERSELGILKDTIMKATRDSGKDWCVSVFKDNAGIIKFDDRWNVSFKVETHNHPSAIEPYGGSNTGIGGVIRDVLGAGLGGKPICNTDVFCVAPPDLEWSKLPPGVIHPARVLQGVVAGVRDYGNRMGIPTVNGAVFFDRRYLGNPLVYCGTVGLMPAEMSFGKVEAGDLIVALGGRTGRDGIHGATFSSGELTDQSETVSGGAVQIGNAITEKKVMDVLLQARDRGLFHAVTDCGAGGFSSAVGEMGETIGATVELDSALLKYEGLSYTEIWISEAQERMVLAVHPDQWPALRDLAHSEDVDAFVLGTFEPTGKLILNYQGERVGELSMEFLHGGRPNVTRQATAPEPTYAPHARSKKSDSMSAGEVTRRILGSWNVCSKEWIVRQYDHEVQAGSVIKPLVGVQADGPSDASVIRPLLDSTQGLAIACGMNPHLGDLDPYRMAMSAVDEAIRNVVAVGGDPDRVALLDNFCWGRTERPEVLGSLVQAARGCRDAAVGYRAPFISGKDSLNNEFTTGDQRIVIPPSLLISAMAIVPDINRCVTMDLKRPGNVLVAVGLTRDEMGGSHFNLVTGSTGGVPPIVDTKLGVDIFAGIHRIIGKRLVRSCHDLSEGGLAVALAEMAFAGGWGVLVDVEALPCEGPLDLRTRLFSESNTRFILEVEPGHVREVVAELSSVPSAIVGEVSDSRLLMIRQGVSVLLEESIDDLKSAWQDPLRW